MKIDKPVRKWVKADLPDDCKIADQVHDNQYLNEDLTPTTLFERFIDDAIITMTHRAMNRNRFEESFCNIHVADNDNLPPGDKMAKVRPLFTELNNRFITFFPRQKNLAVDESMVPYYGRHSAKQYNRGKPIRFGYKV